MKDDGTVDPAKIQHVKGWRRSLHEHDLRAALDRLAARPAPGDPGAWADYYADAVEALRLPGHEGGVDQALAAAQIEAEFAGAARFADVWRAIDDVLESLGRSWLHAPDDLPLADDGLGPAWWLGLGTGQRGLVEGGHSYRQVRQSWRQFQQGLFCLRVVIPSLGWSVGLAWEDVAPHFHWIGPEPTDEFEVSIVEAACAMAIDAALAAEGLYRGPCESCGFERWPVPWAAPRKAGGRQRLYERFCPACEAAHLRRGKLLRQNAYNRRRAGQGP